MMGSTAGAAAAIGSFAGVGVSVAIADGSVPGDIGGGSTLGSSLLVCAGSGAPLELAAASPPVISMSLRMAMAGPHIGCSPIANHVRLPIGYQLRSGATPARLASRRVTPKPRRTADFLNALDRQAVLGGQRLERDRRPRADMLDHFGRPQPAESGGGGMVLAA